MTAAIGSFSGPLCRLAVRHHLSDVSFLGRLRERRILWPTLYGAADAAPLAHERPFPVQTCSPPSLKGLPRFVPRVDHFRSFEPVRPPSLKS